MGAPVPEEMDGSVSGEMTASSFKKPDSVYGEGYENSDLEAAREDSRQRRMGVGIAQALANGLGTITNTRSDSNLYAMANEAANAPVSDIKEGRAAKKDQIQFQEALRGSQNARDAEDPDSDLNAKFQKTIASYAKEVGVDPQSITYADFLRNKDIYGELYKAKNQEKLKRLEIEGELQKDSLKAQREVQKEVKPNADQSKVAVFASRMEQAENNFSNLEKKNYDRASYSDAASRKLQPESIYSENQKLQDQAEGNFLNAVLRRESGAAISPSERDSGEKQYFPRAGDSAAVKEQKRQNRQLAINGFKAEAGSALNRIEIPEARKTSRLPADKNKRLQELRAKRDRGEL
jgi:hypothetical protein